MTSLPNNSPSQQVWCVKVVAPATADSPETRALWIRASVLVSRNGFRRVAETWATFSERGASREISKTSVRQLHEIGAFRAFEDGGIEIGECSITRDRLVGRLQFKGRTLEWDLALAEPEGGTHPFRFGQTGGRLTTDRDRFYASGQIVVDGRAIEFKNAIGMLYRQRGSELGQSWVWGQCNTFFNENGAPTPFVFEGFSARVPRALSLINPRVSSFRFRYGERDYEFNTWLASLRIRSEASLTEWRFQADRGDLSFRGEMTSEHRDFIGLTFEDTHGTPLYCANSKLSDLKVHVYRREKLEATFLARGTASFEIVTRSKNPYVPVQI